MTVLAPPPQHELELLIREARARQRRRWAAAAVAVAALASVAILASAVQGGSHRTPTGARSPVPFVDARAFSGHGLLAFVSRDALYVLDGRSGRLTEVARALEQPTWLSFSPGGRWLTYGLGNGRAGVARADGADPRSVPAHGLSASWLPDGRLLVGRAIYRIRAYGPLIRAGTAPAGLADWAANGSRYAFVTRHVRTRPDGSFRGFERLELADSLGGSRTLWYSAPISFTRREGFRGSAISDVALTGGRVLIWLDAMQSESLAADGMPVYEIRSPLARPVQLGDTVGGEHLSFARGRIALGGGSDRIAWVSKAVLTCGSSGCRILRSHAGKLTLDPAFSPDGRTLAFVTARTEPTDESFVQPTLHRWYATRRLWIGTHAVPDSRGAAAPTWSADGRSLLFVKDDGLWLLSRLDAKPVRVAGPLFGISDWPSYYGQVDWSDQFAWWSGR